LWQAAYAELVFVEELWPDVDRRVLWRAITEYARRDRRYGGADAAPGLDTAPARARTRAESGSDRPARGSAVRGRRLGGRGIDHGGGGERLRTAPRRLDGARRGVDPAGAALVPQQHRDEHHHEREHGDRTPRRDEEQLEPGHEGHEPHRGVDERP